jgi:hypothetical protein
VIVLGIDPGARLCGWALLERDRGLPPRWIDGGYAPAEEIVGVQVPRASLVAVEWLAPGLFALARHNALVDTARTEGGLAWLLDRLGARWTKLSAGQWRADVIGRASPSDEEIEACLRLRVRGIPLTPALSKDTREIPSPPVLPKYALVHALDALGVAYAAAHQPGTQLRLLDHKRRTTAQPGAAERGLQARLASISKAARAYLDARDSINPALERETRARLEEGIRATP